jgi:chemotaxis protein CheX
MITTTGKAMGQTPTDSSAPSSTFIMPFMNAVRQVFQKMAGVETTVNRPHLKTRASASYDVCGIIGFTGQIVGSVVVSFSDQAAEKLVEAFVGIKLERDSADFADAIGELANMIAGSAKHQMGTLASISVPSVVIGKGYTIANMSNTPCVVIPCGSPYGEFSVEVSIKPNQET